MRPDLYAPELNPVYGAMLAHYGVVADPCRVADPNRKGTVESAIQHTQATALKGRRFDSIEAQNAWLAHWEERWAGLRIHGRKKRQVLEMFREEQPHLRALPLEGFRLFKQGVRTVDDAALVQIDGSYYAALPAVPHSEVTVRTCSNSRARAGASKRPPHDKTRRPHGSDEHRVAHRRPVPVRRKRPNRPAVDNSRTGPVACTTRLPIQVAKRDTTD